MHNLYDFWNENSDGNNNRKLEWNVKIMCVGYKQTNKPNDVYYVMEHASYDTNINETTMAAAVSIETAYKRRTTWLYAHIRSIQLWLLVFVYVLTLSVSLSLFSNSLLLAVADS